MSFVDRAFRPRKRPAIGTFKKGRWSHPEITRDVDTWSIALRISPKMRTPNSIADCAIRNGCDYFNTKVFPEMRFYFCEMIRWFATGLDETGLLMLVNVSTFEPPADLCLRAFNQGTLESEATIRILGKKYDLREFEFALRPGPCKEFFDGMLTVHTQSEDGFFGLVTRRRRHFRSGVATGDEFPEQQVVCVEDESGLTLDKVFASESFYKDNQSASPDEGLVLWPTISMQVFRPNEGPTRERPSVEFACATFVPFTKDGGRPTNLCYSSRISWDLFQRCDPHTIANMEMMGWCCPSGV